MLLEEGIVETIAVKIKRASDEFGFRSPRYFAEVDKWPFGLGLSTIAERSSRFSG